MRPQGDPTQFQVGQRVRYRPGKGTYGPIADVALREPDGRAPAVVDAIFTTRVRIAVQVPGAIKERTMKRAVDPASLILDGQPAELPPGEQDAPEQPS